MTVTAEQIIAEAQGYLGTPYVWGGESRDGVDCSGLVQSVYAAYGINLPRVTYDQINSGASVPMDKLRPGDLVFFDTDREKKGPDHVGIYMGGGKFIHAPRTGDVVKVSSLSDSYYSGRWMGGRRVSGVDAAATMGSAANTSQPTVKLEANELAETYGMSYAFFKSQPELEKLLKGAVAGQWSPDRFQAEVKNTKWWKNNSESSRKAQVLAKTDPATYRANMEAARVAARAAAVQIGAVLTPKETEQLAKNMIHFEWNEAQVANFLGKRVEFNDKHTLGGQAGAAAKEIGRLAYENGVRVSEQTIKNNAAYLMRGVTTMEKIEGDIRSQAMSMYPGFADQISVGANMRDLAQPYIQMTAEELGIPETDVSLNHPRVRSAIQRQDGAGAPSPMSLTDYQRALRDDPAWGRTPGAADRTMTVGRQVLADFGLVR